MQWKNSAGSLTFFLFELEKVKRTGSLKECVLKIFLDLDAWSQRKACEKKAYTERIYFQQIKLSQVEMYETENYVQNLYNINFNLDKNYQ